ncbi:MAG: site-specific DNA-methyltransferase, partial [Balneolaceae bacterium]|nr:site-specific DNA-methyltransferase [Balneolaceae bacterium]
LKVLLDEVFARDNYLNTFYVRVRYPDKTLKQDMDFHKEIETIHIYRKSRSAKPNRNSEEKTLEKYVYYFEELSEGKEIDLGGKKVKVFQEDEIKLKKKKPGLKGRKEIWASGSILDGNSSGRFFRDFLTGRYKDDGYGVYYKVYGVGDERNGFRYFSGPKKMGATKGKYYQGVPASSSKEDNLNYLPINNFYDLAGSFGNCRTEGGVELRSGKKPEKLIQILLDHFSDEKDLIVDFHLGSGTTCAVAQKMGRRFIGVEQLDYHENDSFFRLNNVIKGDNTGISKDVEWNGGGSFVYAELKKANQQWVEEIQEAENEKELKAIWEKTKEKAFISYKVNPKEIDENAGEFNQLSLDDQKRFLIEVLDKNLLYVNYSEIDDADFAVSEEDKTLNHQFYQLSEP